VHCNQRCPLWANSGHRAYSITLSARLSRPLGIEIEFCGLLDRQIRGPGAFQNLVHEESGAKPQEFPPKRENREFHIFIRVQRVDVSKFAAQIQSFDGAFPCGPKREIVRSMTGISNV
jgi:hypothetical protein